MKRSTTQLTGVKRFIHRDFFNPTHNVIFESIVVRLTVRAGLYGPLLLLKFTSIPFHNIRYYAALFCLNHQDYLDLLL
jgi:hypothetical protein